VVSAITSTDMERRNSKPAVHSAAMRGKFEVLKLLLEANAPPDTIDESGNTPLRYAIELGQARSVAVLLKWGANPKTLNNFGTAPEDVKDDASWDVPAVKAGKKWIRDMLKGRVFRIQELPERKIKASTS